MGSCGTRTWRCCWGTIGCIGTGMGGPCGACTPMACANSDSEILPSWFRSIRSKRSGPCGPCTASARSLIIGATASESSKMVLLSSSPEGSSAFHVFFFFFDLPFFPSLHANRKTIPAQIAAPRIIMNTPHHGKLPLSYSGPAITVPLVALVAFLSMVVSASGTGTTAVGAAAVGAAGAGVELAAVGAGVEPATAGTVVAKLGCVLSAGMVAGGSVGMGGSGGTGATVGRLGSVGTGAAGATVGRLGSVGTGAAPELVAGPGAALGAWRLTSVAGVKPRTAAMALDAAVAAGTAPAGAAGAAGALAADTGTGVAGAATPWAAVEAGWGAVVPAWLTLAARPPASPGSQRWGPEMAVALPNRPVTPMWTQQAPLPICFEASPSRIQEKYWQKGPLSWQAFWQALALIVKPLFGKRSVALRWSP
mmetsp:Transcript_13715/g.39124  ORF Transcript_13715/g.39124 Transcript_13715/m.39124 type:complete len:422 (-) Transcript_13715:185-1450(-)